MSGLDEALARGQRAWPSLAVSPATFAACLRAEIGDDRPADAALASLCVEDLWLVCACIEQLPGAAEAFRERHLADVRRGLGPELGDDSHVHDLLHDLLVGPPGGPARLTTYRGYGRLGRWVYIVARRRRADLLRTATCRGESATGAAAAAYGDPELAMLRGATHRAVKGALERAASALLPRERNILRYVYVHGLRIDEIAGIYRLSASTIKRRLAHLRTRLASDVRDALRKELGLDDRHIQREIAGLDSALQLTLNRILDRAGNRNGV